MNLKDHLGREETITFVCSKLSQRYGFLAIGGIEGNIFMFNLESKSKVGANKLIHKAEIVDIFFDDRMSIMISVSKDLQISLWDSSVFEILHTFKDTISPSLKTIERAAYDQDTSILYAGS